MPLRQRTGVRGDKNMRTFRTESNTPTEELKNNIGGLICQISSPWIFEIIKIEQGEQNLNFIITCKVTGKLTEQGQKFMEESNSE